MSTIFDDRADLSKSCEPLKSTKFEDNLSIMFGNLDGLNFKTKDGISKVRKLQNLTQGDHMLLLNETNLSETDTKLLTHNGKLGDLAIIRALDEFTFVKGKRVAIKTLAKTRKLKHKSKGYGSAIVTRLRKEAKLHKYKGDHEILYGVLDLNNTSGLVLTGYRSPSSTVSYTHLRAHET